MGLFDKLFRKDKKEESKKEEIPTSQDIDININKIKEILKDCDDIVYRDFLVGVQGKYKLAIIYTDGLIDKKLISDSVLKSLMHKARELEPEPHDLKRSLFDLVEKSNITVTEIKEIDNLNEAIDNILIGETVLLLDKYKKNNSSFL